MGRDRGAAARAAAWRPGPAAGPSAPPDRRGHLVSGPDRVRAARPPPGAPRCGVLPRRWVVERTFAWISKHRRCVRDYERLPEHHEAMVKWAMIALMARRLARQARPAQPARAALAVTLAAAA